MKLLLNPGLVGLALALCSSASSRADDAIATFPIAADPSSVEIALGAASDGTNYLVGVQGDATGPNRVTAQLISASGAPVGTRISTGESGEAPRTAFDGTNYFLLWRGTSLRGQFVSRTGALVGPPLTVAAVDVRELSLASGKGACLACWSSGRQISGRIILPNGVFAGPAFVISDTGNPVENAVAFDGGNFLVVFNAGDNYRPNIYGQFVSPAGALIGSNFLIDGSSEASDNPLAIAYGAGNYLVAFNDEVNGSGSGEWRIVGRLVSPSGVVSNNRLAIAGNPGAHRFPSPAFDASNFLIGWNNDSGGPNMNQSYRFFNPSGEPIGPEFSVFAPSASGRPLFSAPVFAGNQFLLAGTLAVLTNDFEFARADVLGAFLPASTAAPRLNIAGPRTNSSVALTLNGTPGIQYVLQASTNLPAKNWTAVSTNSPTNGAARITDPGASSTRRYYRALKQ